MAEKVFSREAVVIAVRLTAKGMAGLISGEEAEKTIETLPEDLANIVMEESCKAARAQNKKRLQALATMIENAVEISSKGQK